MSLIRSLNILNVHSNHASYNHNNENITIPANTHINVLLIHTVNVINNAKNNTANENNIIILLEPFLSENFHIQYENTASINVYIE